MANSDPPSTPPPNPAAISAAWLQALRFHLAVNQDGSYRFSHIRLAYGSAVPCLAETLQELLTGRTIGEVLARLEQPARPCLPVDELRGYLVTLASQMKIPIDAPDHTNCGLDCGCDQCTPLHHGAPPTSPPPPPSPNA